MKIHITFLLLAMLYGYGKAQNIPSYSFSYDDSGNRIKRELIMIPDNKSMQGDSISDDTDNIAEYNYKVFDYQVRIYPNPTQGMLTVEMIDLPSEMAANITVFDLQGRHIFKSTTSSGITAIDFSAHPAGMYVLQLMIDNRKKEWKILKQ